MLPGSPGHRSCSPAFPRRRKAACRTLPLGTRELRSSKAPEDTRTAPSTAILMAHGGATQCESRHPDLRARACCVLQSWPEPTLPRWSSEEATLLAHVAPLQPGLERSALLCPRCVRSLGAPNAQVGRRWHIPGPTEGEKCCHIRTRHQ